MVDYKHKAKFTFNPSYKFLIKKKTDVKVEVNVGTSSSHRCCGPDIHKQYAYSVTKSSLMIF